MKFTVSWLREFLDFDASIDTLSHTLTAIGLEVDEVTYLSDGLESFTVAHIQSTAPHPDADKLQICTVHTHTGIRQIVCGAPNARANINVILADIGDVIPTNSMKIKPAKIRGIESAGMLCSARELGLGEDHDGIMELPQDAQVGAKAIDVLHLNDTLIDIAITPNRGDCLGVYGIARDLAAAGLGTLKQLKQVSYENVPNALNVTLKTDKCAHFVAYEIDGVTNGESPKWLQQHLHSIGLNSISALVDITNYFTHAYGRPLHVYDKNNISGSLIIRDSVSNERLKTLDGKEHILPDNVCVIADEKNIVAIGGIIGGEASGCKKNTVSVILESAWFDPVAIAQAGRALHIDSDARYRFERTVDAAMTEPYAAMAAQMIVQLCGGTVTARTVASTAPDLTRNITYHPDIMLKRTGMDVAADKQRHILEKLGCTISDTWNITTPSYRPDIEGTEDITEEVLRIAGYDNLEETPLPAAPLKKRTLTPQQRMRHVLSARGLDEVVHFAFTSETYAKAFATDVIRLSNPISNELDTMRPHLFADMLPALKRNHDRDYTDLAYFEVGAIFQGVTAEMQPVRTAALRSGGTSLHWRAKPESYTIYDAKADLFACLQACDINTDNLMISRDVPSYYHPGRSARVSLGPKNILGYFGELHPALLRVFDISVPVMASECWLDALPNKQKTASKKALQKNIFQSSRKDFAFVMDKEIDAKKVRDAILKADKKLIRGVTLFDMYDGEHIEAGKKSLAFAITLQADGRTLHDDDMTSVSEAVVAAAHKTGAILR